MALKEKATLIARRFAFSAEVACRLVSSVLCSACLMQVEGLHFEDKYTLVKVLTPY